MLFNNISAFLCKTKTYGKHTFYMDVEKEKRKKHFTKQISSVFDRNLQITLIKDGQMFVIFLSKFM